MDYKIIINEKQGRKREKGKRGEVYESEGKEEVLVLVLLILCGGYQIEQSVPSLVATSTQVDSAIHN